MIAECKGGTVTRGGCPPRLALPWRATAHISVATPAPFHAIGQFYADCSQTTDDEVAACLERAAAGEPATASQPAAIPAPPARRVRNVSGRGI